MRRLPCQFIAIVSGALFCLLLNGCVSEYSRIEDAVLAPRLPLNAFCEAGVHEMPVFTAEQVLLVRPWFLVRGIGGQKATYDGGAKSSFDIVETFLAFPDGWKVSHIEDACSKLRRLWETGGYRVIVFDRSKEKLENPLEDAPWTEILRAYAMKNGIPIAILYGADSEAPNLPGVPRGLRQYWQCPECAKLYSEQHQKRFSIEWDPVHLLLFPLNVIPDMLAGICITTGYCIYAIFTSDEFGWFVIALPFAPVEGAIIGLLNAWRGRPFWNLSLDEDFMPNRATKCN